MKKIKRFFYNRRVVRYYRKGKAYLNNLEYLKTQQESKKEILKGVWYLSIKYLIDVSLKNKLPSSMLKPSWGK